MIDANAPLPAIEGVTFSQVYISDGPAAKTASPR
jgi:hypothetical protein